MEKFNIKDMFYFFVNFRPEYFIERIKEELVIVNREEILMRASIQWDIDDIFWLEFNKFLMEYKHLCISQYYDKKNILNEVQCLPYLNFKKTPFLKFNVSDENKKTILIKPRLKSIPYLDKIFQFYLYSSSIDQEEVIDAPANFTTLLHSMFLSNPYEIMKRNIHFDEKPMFVRGAIFAMIYFMVYDNITKFDDKYLKHIYTKHPKWLFFLKLPLLVGEAFKNTRKEIERYYLIKTFRNELQGYWEEDIDQHNEIINEMSRAGNFDELIIKSYVALIMSHISSRSRIIFYPYLFARPFLFCRDFFKSFGWKELTSEERTKDEIQYFWNCFVTESVQFLDWVILLNNEYAKKSQELLRTLDSLIHNFSIHSDFVFKDRYEGMIKLSLLKPLKDPLRLRCTLKDIILSVNAERI